jgi:hypothetical protein
VEGSYDDAKILFSEEFESWEDAWSKYIAIIAEESHPEGERVRLAHDRNGELKVIQETRFPEGKRPKI